MGSEEPPFLTVGTDVSAKYKGAFCEAKIKKVNKQVKCKVTFKNNAGTVMVPEDQIRGGPFRLGAKVEAKHPDKNSYMEAVINKVVDYSQYTVVFDDGDETTLRRSSLCLKSGRHFAESETLDQLPLTNPEHFSTPVVNTKLKRKRSSIIQEDDSSDDDIHLSSPLPPPHAKKVSSPSSGSQTHDHRSDYGKVLICQVDQEKKRYSYLQRDSSRESWFPGLVVSPRAVPNTCLTKGEILVRSFKDGRYMTVQKKDAKPFIKDKEIKTENSSLRTGLEHAKGYIEKGKLPSAWESMTIYSDSEDDSEESSDDEPSEIKDRFVAQLISFLDRKRTPINKVPTVNNKDLNLYKLYHTVQKFGGSNKVTNQGLWKKVSIKMGMTTNLAHNSSIYETYYVRYLQDFENFYRQLGCTMTSSPSNSRSQRVDRNIIHTRTRNKTNTPPPTASPSGKKKKERAKSPEKDSKEEKAKEESEEPIKKEKSESPEKKETRGNSKASQDLKKEEKSKPKKDEKAKEIKKEEKTKESKKEEKNKETKKEEKSKDNNKKDDKGKEMKKDEKNKDTKKDEKTKDAKKEDKVKEEDKKKDDKNKPPKKDDKLKETKKDEKNKEPKKEAEKVKKKEKTIKEEKTTNKKEDKPEKKVEKTKAKDDKAKGDKVITPTAKKDKKEKKEEKGKKAKSDDDTSSPPKAQKKKISPKGEEVKRSASLDKKKSDEADPLSSPPLLSPPHHLEDPQPRDLGPIGVGDRIWVKYVRGENNLVGNYEAKVMKVEHLEGKEKKYLIHYRGWNGRHDQWVTEDLITEVVQKNSRSSEKKLPVLSKSTDVKVLGKRGRPYKQTMGGGCSQSPSDKTSSPSSTKRRSCKKSEVSQSEASSQASESSSESSSESDSDKQPPDLEDGEDAAISLPEKDNENIPALEKHDSSCDADIKQETKADQDMEENEDSPPLDNNPEPPPQAPIESEIVVPEGAINEESNDSQLDKEIAATSAEIALELTSKESHSDHEDLPSFEFNLSEALTPPLKLTQVSLKDVSFKLVEIKHESHQIEEFQEPPLIFESHPPEITKCVDAPSINDIIQENNEKEVEINCTGEDEEEPELPTIDKMPLDVHAPKRTYSEIKVEDEESELESIIPAKKIKLDDDDKEDDINISFTDVKESIKRKPLIKIESDLDFTSEESSDSKRLKLNHILLESKDDSDKESDLEKNEMNEESKENQEIIIIKEDEEEEDDGVEILGAVSSQDESEEGAEDPKDLYNTEDSSMSLEVAAATKEAEEIAFLFCEEKVPASPPPVLLNPSADDAAQDASEVLASLSESVVGGVVGNSSFPRPSTVLDNTPPTTPESSLLSTSPSHGSDPCSGRDSADSCDRAKEGPSGGFTPTYPELSTSSMDHVKPDPESGSQKKKKPRNRTSSESSTKHKRKHKDSFSESGKSGKSFPRYNFLAGLDTIENSEKKIQVLHERMMELKKVYQQIKTEIALIDRRRKKTKRKEKEAALSSS